VLVRVVLARIVALGLQGVFQFVQKPRNNRYRYVPRNRAFVTAAAGADVIGDDMVTIRKFSRLRVGD
jgi:hypothetical protein